MGVLANAIRKKREIKHTRTGKEEIKLSFFTEDMIVYTENPEEPIKKKNPKPTNQPKTLLELTSDYSKNYSKVAGYKPSKIKRLVTFLYFLFTSNKPLEFKIKTTTPFILVLKKTKRVQ